MIVVLSILSHEIRRSAISAYRETNGRSFNSLSRDQLTSVCVFSASVLIFQFSLTRSDEIPEPEVADESLLLSILSHEISAA